MVGAPELAWEQSYFFLFVSSPPSVVMWQLNRCCKNQRLEDRFPEEMERSLLSRDKARDATVQSGTRLGYACGIVANISGFFARPELVIEL